MTDMQQSQPRRIERWVARRDTQIALTDFRKREAAIDANGLMAYIRTASGSGAPLPYPFNDPSRWAAIAEDQQLDPEWRAVATWLSEHEA